MPTVNGPGCLPPMQVLSKATSKIVTGLAKLNCISCMACRSDSAGAGSSMTGQATGTLTDKKLSPVEGTMRELDSKDIEGYSAAYNTLKTALRSNGLDPDKTLFVSVGRSPQLWCRYIEKQGGDVAYLPVSGLQNIQMRDFAALTPAEQHNRDAYFETVMARQLQGKEAVVAIDFGITGSSNFQIYRQVKEYLARQQKSDVAVKMATVSPFHEKTYKGTDTSAVFHDDNLFKDQPLNEGLRGINRFLKMQFNEIDKILGLTFSPKFDCSNIDKGILPPDIDQAKLAEIDRILQAGMDEFGSNPLPKYRPDSNKEFNTMWGYDPAKNVDLFTQICDAAAVWKSKQVKTLEKYRLVAEGLAAGSR